MSHTFRALIVLTFLAFVVPVGAQVGTVTGTVTYRERMALPPSVSVEITIEDVSRADAPAEVIARIRQAIPGQPPIPFQLPYDPSRINPRNRYAVRARILDGERLLFTSVSTTLVLTQGRGNRVDLVLQRATSAAEASVPEAAQAPAVAARPLPPVVELRNLPATFAGTGPCEGCPSARVELNLLPDDTFFLRTTRLIRGAAPEDTLGSWVLSSDRRVVVLRTSAGSVEHYAIRDGATLRKLDARGQEPAQALDLRRAPAYRPIESRLTVLGAYTRGGDQGRLVECSTGQTWTLAGDDVRATPMPPNRAGNSLVAMVSVTGRLTSRADLSAPVFTVEQSAQASERACPARFVSLPLVGTYWRLVSLGTTDIAATAGARNEPSLTFRAESRSFSGTGGCNRLTGRYEAGADTLTLVAAGTMMACPSGGEHEAAFTKALAATRRYRVLGNTLELVNDANQVIARFEGR